MEDDETEAPETALPLLTLDHFIFYLAALFIGQLIWEVFRHVIRFDE